MTVPLLMLNTDTCIFRTRGASPPLAVLDWPQEAATHDAEIRAGLEKRGAQLGAADLMIAAHARALGAMSSPTRSRTLGA